MHRDSTPGPARGLLQSIRAWLSSLFAWLKRLFGFGPRAAPSAPVAELEKEFEYQPILPVEVDFHPFVRVSELGSKGTPSALTVQTGVVAYAAHNWNPFDHDGVREIYLDGETISKQGRFFYKDHCIVAQLAEKPGRFWVTLNKVLPGISENNNDAATVLFMYFLRIEDPREFLRNRMDWETSKGQERLRKQVRDTIAIDVDATLVNNDIRLWSAPRIADIADEMAGSLDRKLNEFGLAVTTSYLAQRRYPARLTQIVLQFKAMEKNLLEAQGEDQRILFDRLGLEISDRVRLKSESEGYGTGAGLLVVARHPRVRVDRFITWFCEDGVPEAARLLGELYSQDQEEDKGKKSSEDVLLTESILRSAFKYPMLGLGEWSPNALNMEGLSEYRQLEAFLQQVALG